jgi:hypothetical protein
MFFKNSEIQNQGFVQNHEIFAGFICLQNANYANYKSRETIFIFVPLWGCMR